jgi:hypothetical protein
MRDPEVLFELVEFSGQIRLVPYYFRNDYVGVEQYSRLNQDGVALVRPRLLREHQHFARLWDRNLRAQGFVEAFRRMQAAEATRQ